MNISIFTDGASRGNPGPASYGYVIYDKENNILQKSGKKIGVNTNNFAEYTAVLEALRFVEQNYSKDSPHEISVITDSQLIAKQLSGSYKIKSPNLVDLFFEIKGLENKLGQVRYKNVPREQNKVADRLANMALDGTI